MIVASDGSTDGTDAIADSLAHRGVRLVRNAEQLGKEAVQAAAIERAVRTLAHVSAATRPAAFPEAGGSVGRSPPGAAGCGGSEQ